MYITSKHSVTTKMFKIFTRDIDLLLNKHKSVVNVINRNNSVWKNDNVVKSPFKDVFIPDMTLPEYVWTKNLDKWHSKIAIACGITNRSYTYEQLYKKSQNFAANLRKKLKIKDNDVVAVMMPNMPEYPIVAIGILAAGGAASTVNSIYTAHEVQRQITQSESKAIVTTSSLAKVAQDALKLCKKDLPIICVDVEHTAPEGTISYKEFADNNIDLDILKNVKTNTHDVAFLPYSSGTTGLPKGVELTHRNLIANCEQQNTDCRFFIPTSETHQDSTLALLPLFHSYGMSILMLHKLSVAVKLVTLPKFEPNTFVKALNDNKFNLLYLAPPTVLFLGSHSSVTKKHLENVRVMLCGAAPLPLTDIHRILEKSKEDLHFAQAYGLTETSPLATVSPMGCKKYSSVGVAIPNMELRVVNEDMKNLGPNEVGELLMKGPNVMKGYKSNPKANEESFDGEWLKSGDTASIDESGFVTIADRMKELIKVKGFQVPPAELESLLREHPAIKDAAVVGIPDPKSGEVPKAFVVLEDGVKADVEDIINFVAVKVAPYKKIKDVQFLASIPKSPTGKILRKDIKATYC